MADTRGCARQVSDESLPLEVEFERAALEFVKVDPARRE